MKLNIGRDVYDCVGINVIIITLTIWHICHIMYERRKMEQHKVEFYEKDNGECPVEDFLLHLDKKMRAKMLGIIGILQEKGNLLRMPYSKHLDEGIFELRGKVGSDISRVLYFFYCGGKIVLTNGFIKKTQKTPVLEIERAKSYRKDYMERCVDDEKI